MTTPSDTLPQTDAAPAATHAWSALHVHLHLGRDGMDRFVVDHVAPAVRDLLADGGARSWFFVRYWHGGPHVRVRLLDARDDALADLRHRLEAAARQTEPQRHVDPATFYARFGTPPPDPGDWRDHGEVVPSRYEPEVDRYGGTAAIGIAENLFRVSSDVAVQLLRVAPDADRRRSAALDLLLGWPSALDLDDAAAVRWLRWYVYGWKHVQEVGATDESAVRRLAEVAFDRAEERLVPLAARRSSQARGTADEPAGVVHRTWWQAAGVAHRRLAELDAAGELTTSPELIAASQLHMLHNRLGLTIHDEMELAWLASLALAGGQVRLGFFEDAPTAADRVYLEHSKFVAPRFERDGLGEHLDHRRTPWSIADPVSLDRAAARRPLDADLGSLLARRRSRLGRFDGTMPADDLSALLGHAAGVRGTQQVATPTGTWEHLKRPYPSAGATYGTFLRVAVQQVDGIEPALYEYEPGDHALLPVGGLPSADAIAASSPYFDPTRGDPLVDVREAPAWIAVGMDLSMVRPRYGVRAARFLLLEAGHLAHNLVLVALALGWETTTIGGLFDDAAAQLTQLDGYDETCLYLVPLGRPSST